MALRRYNVLGVGMSAANPGLVVDAIAGWIRRCEPRYVCVRDVHGVVASWRDPALRAIHNAAGLVVPDGMPLVWLAHAHGHPHVRRVYGPDLLLVVCERSRQRGWKHFFYGGAPGVADLLAGRLRERFPGLAIVGTYSPPFREQDVEEDAEVVSMLDAAQPDIIWVGMSTPKQERWMAAHVGRVTAPVLIGIGAAFDFISGVKPQAPRWMQAAGLEWLFRLASEPRRLGKRYLVNIPLFIVLVVAQALHIKEFPLDQS